MSSVFIVRKMDWTEHEGAPDVEGVYSTREKATKRADELIDATKYASYEVEEWEVDEGFTDDGD